ncbi:tetratricopeptide repeat protein [Marinobacter sp. CHS3-4]|uniref:tetratricopeptide repeat protein n=1 Tax=Marinobacter sp. CHS3-4 TaxID=3045174 RepID=UPI0024B5983C|nr:tetratricopeptide repeat protein [Marinobacter sp. CHS3-4]MDI9246594.1 tetratricopeptide repeat protein [Marinobacter sp. CHS3-4]
MNSVITKRIGLLLLAGTLSACATGPDGGSIYVPVGGQESQAPEPPRVDVEPDEPRVERKSEQPDVEPRTPSYQNEGDALSPAAQSLIGEGERLLADGNPQGAISQLERAQRIAPRSAKVYFALAEAYMDLGQLGTAEQFSLKGLSLAGTNVSAQRSGWLLLAEIRQARGNVAGADQARERAARL